MYFALERIHATFAVAWLAVLFPAVAGDAAPTTTKIGHSAADPEVELETAD
jgi:hypothetical protein